jgi:diacylglycerol O-acyltransferase / wax synthase
MAEQTARMRAIDAVWLDAETGGPAVAVGSLVLAEGPPPTVEELRAGVGSRLDRMARLSERAVPSRGPVRRPRWEPVDVDLSYHVREQAVAAPADMGAIEDAVSAVLASPMDLDKPLWDMHLLTGLPVEQFGVVTRLHHAVADGAGSLLLLGHLFDLEPAGGTTLSEFFAAAVTQAAQAQSVSSPAGQESSTRAMLREAASRGGDLTLRALRKVILDPAEAARRTGQAVQQVGEEVSQTSAEVARRAAAVGTAFAPRTHALLSGDPGMHRHWRTTRVSLADVKRIRAGYGVTVNDVVMALTSGGYGALMQGRGQPTDSEFVKILIPVSTRAPHNFASNNQVTGLFIQLPVFGPAPERLRWIAEHINTLKDSGTAAAAKVLVDMLDIAPASIQTLVVRTDTPIPLWAVDSLVTNVPGPQFPLYLMGRRVNEQYPIIPLGRPLWCTIGVVSYDGMLEFGMGTGEGGAEAVLALQDGIQASLAELLDGLA